jgi:HJR/Mrr/RecB family endonuclease
MGAIRLIYDETDHKLKKLGWCGELNTKGTRKVMQSNLRYCLQNNTLYLPEDQKILENSHRLCWGRARVEYLEDHPWLTEFDKHLYVNPLDYHMPFSGIGFGAMYSKRHKETKEGRVPVESFVSQIIIDSITKNQEVLEDLSKNDFESLMAEIFARKGFDVDLYRGSKDDGIDFLAIKTDETDPIITCVQCKHPDKAKPGKKRNTLPVATVREIYGVAKAHNIQKCIVITSSTYSSEAKRFADLKPDEITVSGVKDIIDWIRQYRWNKDE